MSLVQRLTGLDNKFNNISSQAHNYSPGVQADLNSARTRFTGMATALPGGVTNFYDNFSSHLKTIGGTAKAIQAGPDNNPTGTICGFMSLMGSGDFLGSLEEKMARLLAKVQAGAADIEDELRDMLSSLDDALHISDGLQDLHGWLNDAQDALHDLGETLGVGNIKDILAMGRCLTHAAAFTASKTTLLAAEIARTPSLDTRALMERSFTKTGIKGATSGLIGNLTSRMGRLG